MTRLRPVRDRPDQLPCRFLPPVQLDAIIRNDPEVLVDEAARHVRSLLSGPLDQLYPG